MALHTIQYEGRTIAYALHRKNVKYINLRVNPKGKVAVSAGRNVPFSAIAAFVQAKAPWIARHLAELEKQKQEAPENALFDGKRLYYFGKPYCLRLQQGEEGVFVTAEKIWLYAPAPDAEMLRQIYLSGLKERAAQKFEEVMNKIYPFVKEYAIERPLIQIRNRKTIWGSCTPSGKRMRAAFSLSQSWRCILCTAGAADAGLEGAETAAGFRLSGWDFLMGRHRLGLVRFMDFCDF